MAKKAGRANNGMGSIRQRADGRWEARYSGPDGRQHSVYGTTEADVTRKLRAAQHDMDSGAWREPSKMTMSEWLETWLSDYQGHTTGRTVETYTCIVNKHFIPLFGKVKVTSLSAMHVRRLIANMQKQGLSASTVRHAKAVLSAAMNSAIEAGLIHESPVDGIKVQKPVKPKFQIIDREMIPAFISAAEETPYPNELIFLLMTGLRLGELRGLQWDDIDMSAGTMRIERQLHARTHVQCQYGIPKYGETRTIELPPEAIELLKRQRRRQIEQRIAAGANWHEDEITCGLVFRKASGRAHNETDLYDTVKRVAKAIGMPRLHPHDLRHSYAVAALRSGVDVKTVQHNLGHKHASMTLDTYAAYTSDAGKMGAQKLSDYWQNALKNS